MYLAGVSEGIRQQMITQFPFAVGDLPVRYLGLPLVTKCMTTGDYSPLIEQIRKRIGSWTSRFLSYAGRLCLIESVLWSISNFWMAAFRLPRQCIREIDKICSAFLWLGTDLKPRKAKIAWEDVCKPKQEGGLGLRSLKEANEVSCLKLIWRIASHKTSLWVKWINQNLLKNESFWSIRGNSGTGLWMWHKLLKYRSQAKEFCCVELKSGETTSFWFDNWSNIGYLYDIVGSRGIIDMGISRNATVADAWNSRRRRRHRSSILNDIELALETYGQRRVGGEADVIKWKGNGGQFKAKFKTKDTWNHIRTQTPTVYWFKGVWFTHATPKYTFCTWLTMHNRLSTGDRMRLWNNGVSSTCVLCSDPMETRDHLFFSCRYSSQVWFTLVGKLLNSRYSTDWQVLTHYLMDRSLTQIQRFLLRYVFQVSIHTIWRERNARRHGEIQTLSTLIAKFIDKQVRNKLALIRGDRKYEEGLQVWFAYSQVD